MRRQLPAAAAGALGLAAVLASVTGASGAARSPGETPPNCETVTVYENSGTGPVYPVRLCGNTDIDITSLIVDGEQFPERSTKIPVVVFWDRGNEP